MRLLTLEEIKASFGHIRELPLDQLTEAHALAEAAFASANSVLFTEEGEWTSMEALLAELEETQRRFDENRE